MENDFYGVYPQENESYSYTPTWLSVGILTSTTFIFEN